MKKRLPKNFPHRISTVPGWAGTYNVPKFICRIDIDKLGCAGTHGWQVRYGKPYVFFGETVNGKRISPRTALAKAKAYLIEIYAGPNIPIRTTPTKRKTNPIQEAGLRLIECMKNKRTVKDYYVEAVPPSKRIRSCRIYVGTERTITPERLEAAIGRARTIRAEMVQQHQNTRKEMGRKSKLAAP